MLFQVSYSHTGSYGACCAQDYVQADSYDEAWALAGCSAAENETIIDVIPIERPRYLCHWR